jgi:general stress protein CsbA
MVKIAVKTAPIEKTTAHAAFFDAVLVTLPKVMDQNKYSTNALKVALRKYAQ